MGLNYRRARAESGAARGQEPKMPTRPVIFTKAPTTVNGPFDEVPVDRDVTQQVDWEVELGVVIGKSGRNIPRADALGHVFGYTVINDVSARDLQTAAPAVVQGQEPRRLLPDGSGHRHRRRVRRSADRSGCQLRVNGVDQTGCVNTANMIFPVDVIIEWLSKGLTLEAGDIIATGTPEGVGMGRTPQELLRTATSWKPRSKASGSCGIGSRLIDRDEATKVATTRRTRRNR